MNKFSFFTQLAMIVIAVAIVIMYIEPKISTIRDTQDLITSYEVETENVSQVNESLKAKIAAIETVTPEDLQALTRFIPTEIDKISVLKDLETIIEAQSITEFDVAYNGNNTEQTSEDEAPNEYGMVHEHYFSATFEARYSQLKSLLAQLEMNDYLLQVTNLKITDTNDDLIKVDMSLTAFTLASEVAEVTP